MHDTVVVENENLGAEKESLNKELQTLREESSDKLKKKNESLLEKMDKLKESNETEQERVSKHKADMKVEIKELHETVKKMEAEIEEQKVEYLREREVQEQELIEAEAEISTMALSVKFEQDFKKLLEVLKQVAVGKSKQSSQEKPESQILNALEWYNTEALEALSRQNNRLKHDKSRLTRACVRQDVTMTEGDSWDMTFKMVVGDIEMARMSAEGVDKIRHHDEELERARTELHTRIKTNVQIIRRLQGNACVVRNKTRGEVSTMLQQAEQEATAVLTKQLTNKNKNSVSKQVPSKIAELALIDSNKTMRQMEEVVMNQQKEKIAARIATEAKSAAEARTAGKGARSGGGTEGEVAEDEDKLEAMGQELTKLKAELETSKQELALKVEEQEIAEQEGWISRKAKFSEVAVQTKEEAERKAINTEFSRELKEARAKLKSAENELVETQTQLKKARVSWNETTGKEKEKLRAEILELKQATTRPKDLESVDTEDRVKEMASLATKLEESKAEAERMTAMQAEHEMEIRELQDRLEEQASEAFTCRAEIKELQDNNKELQDINEKLQGLKEEDQATTNSVKELKEAQKQLKQMLDKKTTEQRESKEIIDKQRREQRESKEIIDKQRREQELSKETIDKQCRDIGDAKRKNNVTEVEATEKIAQLETALRQKGKEVEEARYQSPPCSEWLVQGEKLTHAIKRIYTDVRLPTFLVYTMRSGVMERLQADTEQELNRILREMVEETMSATRICSNKEAARLVRGSEDDDAIEWVIAQKNKMEKIAAVWDCKRGDMVTIRVETNDDDKPTRFNGARQSHRDTK